MYIRDALEKEICISGYLDDLRYLEDKVEKSVNKSFKNQLKLMLDLFEFTNKYFKGGLKNITFLKKGLLDNDLYNFNKRRNIVLSVLIRELEEVVELPDEYLKLILSKAIEDIYFEDAKKILRAIFKVFYNFGREQRDKLLNLLPESFGKKPGYLFDFLGGVFVSDDSMDIEKNKGGSMIPAYDYNGDINKQYLLRYFMQATTQNILIVKAAIPDIILSDLEPLNLFFINVYNEHFNNGPACEKMTYQLPNLLALQWYSKHLFNTKRLLCILPTSSMTGEAMDPEVTTGTILESLSNHDIYRNIGVKNLRDLIYSGNLSQEQIMQLLKLLKIASQNSSILNSKGNIPLSNLVIGDEISIANRLALSSGIDYLDFSTLKGKFALLRKLQLLGEVFITRNWGNALKKFDLIDRNKTVAIRDCLTHIEEHGFNNIIRVLESEPAEYFHKLQDELKVFKLALYEDLAERQKNFPIWPKDNGKHDEFNSQTGNWLDFAKRYWSKIKQYYDTTEVLYKEKMFNTEELKEINKLNVFSKEEMFMFLGINPLSMNKNSFMKKLEKCEKDVKKRLESSFKAADKNIKEAKASLKKKSEQRNEQIKQNILDNMINTYKTISDLGGRCMDSGDSKVASPSDEEICSILEQRLFVLEKLMLESNVSFDNLNDVLKRDTAFNLSASYLLEQIINILKIIVPKRDIGDKEFVARVDDYVNFRNHLGHTDPIVETSEISYHQMDSKMPMMGSVIIKELLVDYKELLSNLYFIELKEDFTNLRQEKPLQLNRF